MLFVDVERGRAEGIALARELQGDDKLSDGQSIRSRGSRYRDEAEERPYDN